jgi:hypothetical protein
MSTQHTKLKAVRWTAFLVFFIIFGCGRSGSSGHRGVSEAAQPADPVVDKPAATGAGSGTAGTSAAGPVAYAVYMDNSASMDGYLAGAGTDFKNDVHTLLKDLQTQGIADTIDLGYVNERICPYAHNASAADANAFIRTLNHDSLVRNGCGRKDSYMDAMLQQVIGADADAVHVLISDYIFSIGRGNSSELLKQQGDNVETVLTAELRKRDFSTMILKFSSDFNGTYYVESKGGGNGSAVPVRGIRRPYYIMFFGAASRMRKLVEFYKSSKFRTFNGFEHVCYLFEPGGHPPAAKLIRKSRVGDFEIAQPATRLVIDKAVGDSGDFQFAVAVDLDELKLDEAYLTNPANYELPANYKIAGIVRNTDPTDQPLRGFSHVFLVRTGDLKPVQDVYIRLKSRLPEWVYTGSTMDDANPADTMQQKQTFGFSYLVEGISRAYADRFRNMDQFALNIQVAQGGNVVSSGGDGAGGGSGEGGGGHAGLLWLVGICAVIVGLVVWIKNKR